MTGINKVIKFLADFDFTFSIILMLFIALFLNFNTFMFQTFTAFTIISFIFWNVCLSEVIRPRNFHTRMDRLLLGFWLAFPFTGVLSLEYLKVEL
jgi:glycine betaine transporter